MNHAHTPRGQTAETQRRGGANPPSAPLRYATRQYLKSIALSEALMNLLIANALPPGGTIGIVSPASPYALYSDVLRGIAWWEARGFQIRLAEGALARTDYVAGSPELRARDLMTMFSDSTIHAVQCLRGGYGSAQVI